ncbi:MAG: thioredoxin domain-containing protein [Bacteroidota bacterium]
MQHTNRLIHSSSPYLLQHAHNPVDWHPWSEEAFQKAKTEDKLVLVSIGYSACHWCHVMEHESFEDVQVAKVMNDFFVCIKVDREERPDIDQVYMDAVQIMNGQGGWPLNCFTLPDGKPVYGGTYFRKDLWLNILLNLHALYKDEKEKVLDYAKKLTDGLQSEELITEKKKNDFSIAKLTSAVQQSARSFDRMEGGMNRAPKFPMPCLWNFFLEYGHFQKDENILSQVKLTLGKMAMGGIFDQAGGGFARYSVDMLWKAPHFEKMLYDNAQLVSLYSNAYKKSGSPLYMETVEKTFSFLQRELSNREGGYFCALDADSEGEEGKYYVWTEEEFSAVCGEDSEWAKEYYNFNERGEWEHGQYILLRRISDEEFCKTKGWSREELAKKTEKLSEKLLQHREKRTRPGLDDKTLTSWNGLMIKGFADAYKAFGDEKYKTAALECAHFIMANVLKADGGLWHSYKKGKPSVEGFLEDYAFVMNGLHAVYEITGDEKWLVHSQKFFHYTLENFYDENSGLFFFTHKNSDDVIVRKKEWYDNVIPSSNSVMAEAVNFLGKMYGNTGWIALAERMRKNVSSLATEHLSAFSNWASLLMKYEKCDTEAVITGPDAEKLARELQSRFLPGVVFAFSKTKSRLPLLTSRLKTGQTLIYICKNNSCNLPVETVEEAMKQLMQE